MRAPSSILSASSRAVIEVGAEPDGEDPLRALDVGGELARSGAAAQASRDRAPASRSPPAIARAMAAPARIVLAYATVWHQERSRSGVTKT